MFENLRQIIFSKNKISDIGLKSLIENLPERITELDLAGNYISSYGCMLLKEYFISSISW